MADSFAHLHVHTEYSMLDGAAHIGPLVKAAADMEMPAIAMTDHGNMFGAYEFWKAARGAGVKPIIGTEAYLTPGTNRSDKTRVKWGDQSSNPGDDVSGGGAYTHITMLSETTEGMHNLFRLSSLASLEGYYFKPRMDRELLQRFSKGIIATTGCPSGEIQTRLRLGQYDEAKKAAGEFQDIFGRDNYFLELMDHGLDIERRVRDDLLRLAREVDIPLVASNDLHYTHSHDAKSHDALLCVSTGSTINDHGRFKLDGGGYYLKSPGEMRQLFRELPEACDNTLLIAERCNVEFDESANYMPRYDVPEGESEQSWFIKEVQRGLNERYGGNIPGEVQERANYESEVIVSMGFPGYFLVVADFIEWAKKQGIRVGPGRGSGAGSMAAYSLGITGLDPLEHGLLFERFLNPERVSMPDFDVDFDERRRGEVIRYVTDKYGVDRVAQVVTYGTIKTKQALKDSARVLGHPFGMGEKLTKALPPAVMAKDIPLAGITDEKHERYREAGDFRALIDSDPEAKTVFETAQGLEGLKRQWGVHACAVIMSSEELQRVIPVMKREQDGAIITQFDYPTCESLGLLKMDFLGLRNLTIIDDALDNIESNRGHRPVLEQLDFDDRAAYELLSRGDSLGVFQLDGGPMRSLLRLLKPDNFEDISALIALYRPGPMGANSHTNYALRKNALQEVTPIHAELEEPLKDIIGMTYGLIIYQEQVMAIAQKVAGFSLGQADILRRAMGKKKKEELDRQYVGFEKGMLDNGYSKAAVKTLWDILLPFSDYAFNKSHSAAYGVLSYWTAYLKAHYPAEYMAALLTSVGDSRDKMALYLSECRRMGITVLSPHVNESSHHFTAVGADIRFGLGAVRNVGTNVVDAIIKAREEQSPATGLHDFLKKMPLQVLNKRTIESLVKAGAFDDLGATRRAMVEVHEEAVDAAVSLKRNEAHGMVDLFGDVFDDLEESDQGIPERPEWVKNDKLSFERDMLGLYVSDHPLAGLELELAKFASHQIQDIGETAEDGDTVTIAGLVTNVQHRVARNSGNAYGILTVEDFGSETDVMLLGKTFTEYGHVVKPDSIAVIRARVRTRDDGYSLTGNSVEMPNVQPIDESRPLELRLMERRATVRLARELKQVLQRHTGPTDVKLRLERSGAARVFQLPVQVKVSSDLFGELKSLLGPSALV
ncbi:MAG: DNA polymerase III subunit alpha [Agrococcus casei]|uniref:DNA polymerase III subunit alpha n=1 Tax=Agrococcus casei TaxID=343512 RepID=UPI003F958691